MLTSKKVPSAKKILWPVTDLATVPTNAQERTAQTNQRPTVRSFKSISGVISSIQPQPWTLPNKQAPPILLGSVTFCSA